MWTYTHCSVGDRVVCSAALTFHMFLLSMRKLCGTDWNCFFFSSELSSEEPILTTVHERQLLGYALSPLSHYSTPLDWHRTQRGSDIIQITKTSMIIAGDFGKRVQPTVLWVSFEVMLKDTCGGFISKATIHSWYVNAASTIVHTASFIIIIWNGSQHMLVLGH